MNEKAKYERSIKKVAKTYIKKTIDTAQKAFEIGLDDGKNGRIPNVPRLPKKDANMKVYSITLFAREMYMDGYRAGKKMR